eukprot:CAMPEP_0116067676 /NCGR_PEP_ID=MMETSP0322-20121206/11191_1 /TAXON_ID=163516 /ORGANISM="Leptocylindrus danicus var. apora, Strain B651" /LENGTH=976 /DNA_ID=CAMNT_0003554609 /DNA_START=139 /DNA_END=3066 /DNA_ORIENTATION=-
MVLKLQYRYSQQFMLLVLSILVAIVSSFSPNPSQFFKGVSLYEQGFDRSGRLYASKKSDGNVSRGKRNKDGEDKVSKEDEFLQNGLVNSSLLDRASTLDNIANVKNSEIVSRRVYLGAAMFGLGMAVAPSPSEALDYGNLKFKTSPVNKRFGVTVYDAETKGYFSVKFVTYLSRFLINFDADCQRWWYARAADIPRDSTVEQVNQMRLRQFGAFSASVEVGLQEYEDEEGPGRLLRSLLKRFCPQTKEELDEVNRGVNISPSALDKQQHEIKEARRQLALLFALLEDNQPVEQLTKLLAAIDNGSIEFVVVNNGGEGYAPGYGSPYVVFPEPEAGEGFSRATGRAVLGVTGKLLRIDLVHRGSGYTRTPTVTISPPSSGEGKAAIAQAVLIDDGVSSGRIERISITSPGEGYSEDEPITVTITPAKKSKKPSVVATAKAIREYKVNAVKLIDGGSGYATEKPLDVYVEPPPLTARINMNDPMYASAYPTDVPLPSSDPPRRYASKEMSQNINTRAQIAAGSGGGGNCVGRACYDEAVKVTAYPRAEYDSYQSRWNMEEFEKVIDVEKAVEQRAAASRIVSATTTGYDFRSNAGNKMDLFGKATSSSQLLNLLPSGYGLEYNKKLKRYNWALARNFEDMSNDWLQGSSSSKPLDPDFGPRGRSPIERVREYDLATALRFTASGAICCSSAHIVLTPIDVVKTKMQIEPKKYTNVFSSFEKVLKENDNNFGVFFTGWAPTLLGYLFWGGAAYTIVETLRRYLTEYVGPANASSLEVPIIVFSAACSALVGGFLICPFEAVRIRSVSQPDYAEDVFGVLKRMINDEGIETLFAAVPAFLLKEVPFAMAKFTVFDLTSEKLYELFPVAQEDIQLSLYVSLFSGTMGGIVAAFVSNPADSTISEMKKAKSDLGPLQTAKKLLEKDGISSLFTGLYLRMFFYSLMVSIQFFLYDFVKYLLGIGTDDLKLYLDVLGGALTEGG